MRISDWSSDVCSSDLIARRGRPVTKLAGCSGEERARKQGIVTPDALVRCQIAIADQCPDPEAAIGRVFDFVKIQPVDIDQVRWRFDLQLHEVQQVGPPGDEARARRSEEHTSELQSLMRISYAVFCLKKKNNTQVHS